MGALSRAPDDPKLDPLTDQERRGALAKLLLGRLAGPNRPLPLSHGQDGRWALARAAPGIGVDNMSFAWRIRAPLDPSTLRAAFQALLVRHSSLRSVFAEHDGRTVRYVREDLELPFSVHEVQGASDAQVLAALKREAAVPFDLERGPAIRVHLFVRSSTDMTVLMTAHHIVADFWSLGILLPQLSAAYLAIAGGGAADVTPHPADYTQFVMWQAAHVVGPGGAAALRFWGERLSDGVEHVELPLSRPRPAKRAFQDDALQFAIPEATAGRLRALAAEEGSTLFMVLLAAFKVLIHSYSGQRRLVVVSPTAGRTLQTFHDHVGEFANHTFFQSVVDGSSTFSAFLAQVRETVSATMEYRDFPFDLLSRRVRVNGVPEGAVPFPVKFNMPRAHTLREIDTTRARGEPGVVVPMDAFDVQLELIDRRVTATCDLHLGLLPTRQGLIASLQYNTEVFDPSAITEMSSRYCQLLDILAGPHGGQPAQARRDLRIRELALAIRS